MGSAAHLDLTGPQVQQEDPWRKQVLDLLTQMVQVQKETAVGQAEIIRLLGTLESQGSQQILDLQNVARHQSLLVENHQALLLQTSRISSHLLTPVQPASQ
ncbi:unnamed protein product [Scomber scombrus]